MTAIDFTPLTKSGIAVTHFARLCGVSRISVYKWVRGDAEPRGLYRPAIQKVLSKLEAALNKGTLPLPKTARDDRFAATVRALRT